MIRLAFALALVLLGTTPAAAQRFCGEMFRAGKTASGAGNLEGADRYFSRSIICLGGDRNASVPVYYARGMNRFTLKQHVESAADFDIAIERELRYRKTAQSFPVKGRINLGWVRLYRALALLAAGQYQDALAGFEEAAEGQDVRDPLNPHIDQPFRQFDFELDDIFRGMNLEASAMYGRGVTKLRLGDAVGGEADIGIAVRQEPQLRTRMSAIAPIP